MFAFLAQAFYIWLNQNRRQPCYAYLSSSADLAVLEQRIRSIDRSGWRD